jgi:hypothetical protein
VSGVRALAGECTTLEDIHQRREERWDEPPDKAMDEWAMTREEDEFTKASEAAIPENWTDDLLWKLQAWFTQETERAMQKVTLDGDRDRDLRRSSLIW